MQSIKALLFVEFFGPASASLSCNYLNFLGDNCLSPGVQLGVVACDFLIMLGAIALELFRCCRGLLQQFFELGHSRSTRRGIDRERDKARHERKSIRRAG
jgi:hypothetical protein